MNKPTSPSRPRVLVVGPDADGLGALTEHLPDVVEIVGRATSPARALDLLEGRKPQLVLVDLPSGDEHALTAFITTVRDRVDLALLLLLPPDTTPLPDFPQYLHKPCSRGELTIALRALMHCKTNDEALRRGLHALAEVERERDEVQARLAALEGVLAFCTYCQHVRNEAAQWEELHHYLSRRMGVAFTHGVCESCQRAQAGGDGGP